MGTSEHYSLLFDVVTTMMKMAEAQTDSLIYFKDLPFCRQKLIETAKMLELKMHNYRMLEKF